MFPNIPEIELSLANIIVPLWLVGWLAAIALVTNAQLYCSLASAHLPKATSRIYFMDVAPVPWAPWTADRLKGEGLDHHNIAVKNAQRGVFSFAFLLVATISTMACGAITAN